MIARRTDASAGTGLLPMTGRERMLASLRLEIVDRPPVWFMRQAGRHLPGYRELRREHSFLDLCRSPELCAAASCEPWRVYGVDGVIVFNDILVPLRDMGMELDFVPGPRFPRLIHRLTDVWALREPMYDARTDVCRGLAAIRDIVGQEAGLLGFVGAPFTVASFAVAGQRTQQSSALIQVVSSHPIVYEALQQRLGLTLAAYAEAQVAAGADVIQIFESLASELPAPVYRDMGLPWLVRLTGEIRTRCPGTPVIVFGRGLWPFIPELASAGADCLSLDGTHDLADARLLLAANRQRTALQGNLAPGVLLGMPSAAARSARLLLSRWRQIVPAPSRGPTGWIFNLGHGVPECADPRTVLAVAEAVRQYNFSGAGGRAGRERGL